MSELLSHVSNLSVQIFAIASMAAVGIRYTVHEILEPLQNLRGVLLALVANFVAVPLLAFLILRLLSLERGYAIGLLLVAAAAGAPFVIELTRLSGGSVAFASGLLVLLLVASIGYMPFVIPRLAGATVSAWAMAAPLVWTMLLPLVAGLFVDARWPRVARAFWPALALLANAALLALIVSTFLLHLPTVLGVFGTGAILASLLLLAGAFLIGWLFGGFGKHLDDEMAFGTAQRNFAAAMVVASQNFADSEVLVMVVVVSLVSIAVLFPAAKLMGRHVARRSATPA